MIPASLSSPCRQTLFLLWLLLWPSWASIVRGLLTFFSRSFSSAHLNFVPFVPLFWMPAIFLGNFAVSMLLMIMIVITISIKSLMISVMLLMLTMITVVVLWVQVYQVLPAEEVVRNRFLPFSLGPRRKYFDEICFILHIIKLYFYAVFVLSNLNDWEEEEEKRGKVSP